jgi:hypothetical protein
MRQKNLYLEGPGASVFGQNFEAHHPTELGYSQRNSFLNRMVTSLVGFLCHEFG